MTAYSPEILFDCTVCLRSVYEHTETSHNRVNGADVCGVCVDVCQLCGQMLTDADIAGKVIVIRFREWENDGQLSPPTCPKCAADWIIGTFIGSAGTFDSDDYEPRLMPFAVDLLLASTDALPSQWKALPIKEAHDAA